MPHNWKPTEFKIDQRGEQPRTVSGFTCQGVGIYHYLNDTWTITHLSSGLRILDVYVDTKEEAFRFGDMVLDLGNWDFGGLDVLPEIARTVLRDGAIRIMDIMRAEYDARCE
jgi:hypothetical protein